MEQANTAAIIEEVSTKIEISNVVAFPAERRTNAFDLPPMTMEEAKAKLAEVRSYMAEEIADEAYTAIIQIFASYGVNVARADKFNRKDLLALSEVLISIVMRYYGLEHPMQNVIDKAIFIEGDEPGIEDETETEESNE